MLGGEVGFGGAELAEEEAEAADGEAYAHQAEAGADPGEEGSLGGEVDSGVLFRLELPWRDCMAGISDGIREQGDRVSLGVCGGPRWSCSVGSGRRWF